MAAEFDFEQVEAFYNKEFSRYKIAKAPTGAAGPFPTDVPVERVIITRAYVVEPK